MSTIEKLLGGEGRVKLLKLFLLNPGASFTDTEIIKRTHLSRVVVRKDVAFLQKAQFLVRKLVLTEGKRGRKKRVPAFRLHGSFPQAHSLRSLVHEPIRDADILRQLKGGGNLKLVIISGVFTDTVGTAADLLIVGEKLKRKAIDLAISRFEAKLGRELRYAILETGEFDYRRHAHDRFVRDILDFPHRKLLNKLGI